MQAACGQRVHGPFSRAIVAPALSRQANSRNRSDDWTNGPLTGRPESVAGAGIDTLSPIRRDRIVVRSAASEYCVRSLVRMDKKSTWRANISGLERGRRGPPRQSCPPVNQRAGTDGAADARLIKEPTVP